MSPYLHFGHISPVYLAAKVREAREGQGIDRAAYLEELIVRRELALNFVWYTPDYDRYACLPDWARKTLAEHAGDDRPRVYDRETLENAATHDPYWNAAMREMEEQLAGLPPEQRAMAEAMMKGQMQGMMGGAEDAGPRVEAVGTGKWQTSSCQQYAVFEGARKTQEICAASLSAIDGSAEAMQAGILAAAGIIALTDMTGRLAEDHANARKLADGLAEMPGLSIDPSLIKTDIVYFEVTRDDMTGEKLLKKMEAQ